LVNQKDTKIKN